MGEHKRDDVSVVLYMANGRRVKAEVACWSAADPDSSMMIGIRNGSGVDWHGAPITPNQLDNFCRQGSDLAKRAGADPAAADAGRHMENLAPALRSAPATRRRGLRVTF